MLFTQDSTLSSEYSYRKNVLGKAILPKIFLESLSHPTVVLLGMSSLSRYQIRQETSFALLAIL